MKNHAFTREQAVQLTSQALQAAYRPHPDDPALPSGPWAPIIRSALKQSVFYTGAGAALRAIAQRYPQVWDLWGNPLSLVALNPQPLPPGDIAFAFALAQEVIDRALLIHDLSVALRPEESGKAATAAAGLVQDFTDDLCPVPPKIVIPRKKGPFPVPPDAAAGWAALEMMAVGISFVQAAEGMAVPALQEALHAAGNQILDVGLSRL
ncbi:hypothetical protein EGT74_13495 [Chitinophaga lutea]|uniref:Uncharacterized protein n=1 Tax=Chitinophaga lutea TaxID=2488634 RepID=A0A3N4PWH1_9BACT|nr:hypothetical protein [Chitinophaga lutea]RPE08080.1 hypothetical protein EGT74_13495 [Chitinophaga lutea]